MLNGKTLRQYLQHSELTKRPVAIGADIPASTDNERKRQVTPVKELHASGLRSARKAKNASAVNPSTPKKRRMTDAGLGSSVKIESINRFLLMTILWMSWVGFLHSMILS